MQHDERVTLRQRREDIAGLTRYFLRKHGPALGEVMAELILKDGELDAVWRLSRFQTPS